MANKTADCDRARCAWGSDRGSTCSTDAGNPHYLACPAPDAGCYARADAPCGASACDTTPCALANHGVPRPERKITFVNRTARPQTLFYTAGGRGNSSKTIATLAAKGDRGDSFTQVFSHKPHKAGALEFGDLQANTKTIRDRTFTYYTLPRNMGLNFGLYPPDEPGVVQNTTLFEIFFNGDGGAHDEYDISAIPPGSCAAHLQSKNADGSPNAVYGYADNLPFKAAGSPHCLGGNCGTGLGTTALCPPVTDPATGKTLTVRPPAITTSGAPGARPLYGCGTDASVVGTCCATPDNGVNPLSVCKKPDGKDIMSCCPHVCAMPDGADAADPAVRDAVHRCAHLQSMAKNANLPTPVKGWRGTGYYTGIQVVATMPEGSPVPAGCAPRSCVAPGNDPTKAGMAASCQGYLWPYDDAHALAKCDASPDYTVTFFEAGDPPPTPGEDHGMTPGQIAAISIGCAAAVAGSIAAYLTYGKRARAST
jgi:hypothetical protein